jgi:nitroreductase
MSSKERDGDGGSAAGNPVLEAIRARRSIRLYKPDPVPEELLRQVLDAAHWAPSAANLQPWQFVVVTDAGLRRELGKHARIFILRFKHVEHAPVVIAILGNPAASRWHRIDCSLAGANIMLAAHALGLGTCWIGAFYKDRVQKTLGIPAGLDVVGLITLGFPDETPAAPPRLDLDDIVHRERFQVGRAPTLAHRLTRSGVYSLRRRLRSVVAPRVKKRR